QPVVQAVACGRSRAVRYRRHGDSFHRKLKSQCEREQHSPVAVTASTRRAEGPFCARQNPITMATTPLLHHCPTHLPMRFAAPFFALVLLASTSALLQAEEIDVPQLCATVRQVGPMGANHKEAMAAVAQLSKIDSAQLPRLLAGMDGAG